MLARIWSTLSGHVTYANVASTLALVIALGSGTAYAANTVFSTDIVNGQVKAVDLGASAVNSNKIGDGQVQSVDVNDESLTTSDVLNETLTTSDLATDSVNATEIADNSIDSGEIFNESLLAGDLASSSVGTSEIAASAVTGGDIAASTITGADVANNSLTTADIAGADINGGHITLAAGSVANGRCRQFDSSNGGTQAGEAVLYSVQGALQNGILIYGSRVPSAGHVTVNVCNFSGTTQAAINNLPVRVITFG